MEGKIISDKSTIKIKNLNVNKRPISSVADNKEVRNAKIINIKINKKLNLIFFTIDIVVFIKRLK